MFTNVVIIISHCEIENNCLLVASTRETTEEHFSTLSRNSATIFTSSSPPRPSVKGIIIFI